MDMSTTDTPTDNDTASTDTEESLEDRVARLEANYERQLEDERERRRELEAELNAYRDLFDFRRKTEDGIEEIDPQDATLNDVWIAGAPIGQIVDNVRRDTGLITSIIHELTGIDTDDLQAEDSDKSELQRLKTYLEENDVAIGDSSSDAHASVRDDIHEAHRWMLDLNQNGCEDRNKEQTRVAHLFRRFVRAAAGEPETGVDASGQTYSVTTKAAADILLAENMLENVTKKSRGTTAARMMRAAQRETSYGVDCSCDDVDDCPHALLEFRPGKPHTLAVRKPELEEYLEDYTERVVSTAAEADDGGNSPEDSGQQIEDSDHDRSGNEERGQE